MAYACLFVLNRLPGVAVMEPLPACDLHAAIQDSFAVVNSSTSEGMASALLEVLQQILSLSSIMLCI